MSAQSIEPEAMPPVPDGWERVNPGRPLLKLSHSSRVRLSVQWCPVCGPDREIFDVGQSGGRTLEDHILEFHAGSPQDFGMAPIPGGGGDDDG